MIADSPVDTDTIYKRAQQHHTDVTDLINAVDYLTRRVAELENPLNLTDEHRAARIELADRLNRAANNAPAAQIQGDHEIGKQLGLLLRIIAGHIRHDDRLGGMFLRRADKLAALLLGEEPDHD